MGMSLARAFPMTHLTRLMPAAALLGLLACGGGTTQDANDGGAAGAAAAGGAGGTAGAGGHGGTSAGACDGFSEEPSQQSVDVTITNGAAVDRYLMVSTYECDPQLIERLGSSGYEAVTQSVGFQCGCECPGPPAPGPRQLRRIGPAESITVSWDARELAVCIETVDCMETYGFEGTADIAHGFPQPAPSGDYRITYQLFETAPTQCSETADGYECEPNAQGSGTECSGEVTAVASFTLPATGDVSTSVTVD